MIEDPRAFFAAVIDAGAILTGFCGTFLSFRIQREADYFQQPAVSFERGKGINVVLAMSRFNSSFLLLLLASLGSVLFGLLLPLLGLAGFKWANSHAEFVVAGLVAALILLVAYFLDEMIHYRVISSALWEQAGGWGSEWWIVGGGMILAAAFFLACLSI